MNLKNQKVVIMGGASGIGLSTAKLASAAGAQVIITGRNSEKLKNALAELSSSAKGVVVDAKSSEALQNFYLDIGKFDHLVLSMSGKVGGGSFKSLNSELLHQAFDAKFFPYFLAIQYGLQTLNKTGSIVLVTAGSARSSFVGTSGLAAINGALEAMIPPLTLELKPLRINAVSPGIINTPWWNAMPKDQREHTFAQIAVNTPVGRIGHPDDIAQAILFLLENTYMAGTIIECDGGMRIK